MAATVLPASPEGAPAPAFIRALFESARAGGLGEPTVIRVNRDDLEQGGMPFPFPISMIVSRHAPTPPPDGDAGTGDDA